MPLLSDNERIGLFSDSSMAIQAQHPSRFFFNNSNGQEASDCSLQPQDTPFTNFTKAGLSSHYSHIVSKFFPSIPFNHHRF
jgi:E3 ubiquitin-protein ligase BOI-like protein